MKEGRLQGGEGGQPRRTSLAEEGSMSRCVDAKALQDDLQSLISLQVWPNLKWEKRFRDEEPAHKMTRQNESG